MKTKLKINCERKSKRNRKERKPKKKKKDGMVPEQE